MWIDGAKEFSVEGYPPWTYVAEMRESVKWLDPRVNKTGNQKLRVLEVPGTS